MNRTNKEFHNYCLRAKTNVPTVAIIAVETIIRTAIFTKRSEYGKLNCAGKVASTAAANPLVRIKAIIGRSLLSEVLAVVIQIAPKRVKRRINESTTPANKRLKLVGEKIKPRKTKKKVLIRNAISR